MLPRPPSCCRAVQRQLLQPADSIWLSDEILHHAFQKFVLTSRTTKRHGSFVPGPLEGQRRLGKRKMGHLSESTPQAPQNHGSLWGVFGEIDRTQWKWEAPRKMVSGITNSREASVPTLPAWLENWDTSLTESPVPLAIESPSTNIISEEDNLPMLSRREIDVFRTRLRAANPIEKIEICEQFNQRFQHSITLGKVSQPRIWRILRIVPMDIHQAFSDSVIAEAKILSFYQAFWDGTTTSEVLSPNDLNGGVLARLLLGLGKLSTCSEVQTLFDRVIHAASISQSSRIRRGVTDEARAWISYWLSDRFAVHPQRMERVSMARVAVSETERKVDILLNSVYNATEGVVGNQFDLAITHSELREVRSSFDRSFETVLAAEKLVTPPGGSTETLCKILNSLPQSLLHPFLSSCTGHVINIHNSMNTPESSLHNEWLSLVAKLPNLEEAIFVDVVKKMTQCKDITHPLPGDVILSRWTSQGHIMQPALVRNTFDILASNAGPIDLDMILALLAIEKHRKDGEIREDLFSRIRALFKLLENLGRFKDVYRILAQLRKAEKKLPVAIISSAIEKMSKYDVRRAYKIHYLYSDYCSNGRLQAYMTPNFVLRMVHEYGIHPQKIWNVIGIPYYEARHPSARSVLERRLSRNDLGLLEKVALAFACTNVESQRVAFRNICNCWHHLRRHHFAPTPAFTRAMTHAAFTGKIAEGKWISKDRLRWALGLIEWAEGTEVAEKTEMFVQYWDEQFVAKGRTEARERNVLRRGPID